MKAQKYQQAIGDNFMKFYSQFSKRLILGNQIGKREQAKYADTYAFG